MHPRRGEVWWVAFDPAVGGEIRKTRPAVVVSNNAANTAMNRIVVVPLTTKIGRVFLAEALVHLNGEPRKAMTDQITVAAKERLRGKLGALNLADIAAVETALLVHLGIRR